MFIDKSKIINLVLFFGDHLSINLNNGFPSDF